ncbi:MAG TPA: fibronectin type III domain-containing protein [Niastella sp.]
MSRIIYPFKQVRDSELAKTANRILGCAKGNSFFPDTTLVQELEKRTIAFQVSMNNAADGGKTLIAIRKDCRRSLIEIMVQYGFYVSQICKGDQAMLLSSGFDLSKEVGVLKLQATIDSLEVSNAKPGEAYIKVNSVKGARAYVHQYSMELPTGTTVWVSETTTSRKHTFTGLKPMATYWFRVIAVGRNGQSVISEPVSRVIL